MDQSRPDTQNVICQYTTVNSTLEANSCDDPKGSISKLLYVNDVVNTSQLVNCILFTDDINNLSQIQIGK